MAVRDLISSQESTFDPARISVHRLTLRARRIATNDKKKGVRKIEGRDSLPISVSTLLSHEGEDMPGTIERIREVTIRAKNVAEAYAPFYGSLSVFREGSFRWRHSWCFAPARANS